MIRLVVVLVALTLFNVAVRANQERIVSIGGSVTEIVYALGAGDRLVAVDSTSLYPEAATDLPDVGYMRRLSAEPILALEPDRILAVADAGPKPVLDQLREAGVDITVIDDDPSPEGIVDQIEGVAQSLGLVDQGEILAGQVAADFDALAAKVDEVAVPPRVMFVLNTGRGAPMVGGTGTSADAINERMRHLLDAVADIDPPANLRPAPGLHVNEEASPPDLAGLQLLYVGGRYHLLPHLRARAEALDASLIHHDGGQEETLKSLDGLVEQADVVFCPIDCISHQACLKAKHLCKRQAKPFVPLRSSSASYFARAIKGLDASADGLEDVGTAPNVDVNAQVES